MTASVLPFPGGDRLAVAQAASFRRLRWAGCLPPNVVPLPVAPAAEDRKPFTLKSPEMALFLCMFATMDTDQQDRAREALGCMMLSGDPAAADAYMLIGDGG